MATPAEVTGLVDAIAAHEIRLLAGLDAAGLAAALALGARPRRPVVRLDLAEAGGAERAVGRIARGRP